MRGPILREIKRLVGSDQFRRWQTRVNYPDASMRGLAANSVENRVKHSTRVERIARGRNVGVLLLIIFGGLLVWAMAAGVKTANLWAAENATFMGEHKGWEVYFSTIQRQVLAVEPTQKRIAIGPIGSPIEVPWSAINSAEIERNGQSIQKTNRGSQVMGAAVGAVLLGPLGLLAGALTGSKRQQEWVNLLNLKVIIEHPESPLHRITFFHSGGKGVKPNNARLAEAARKLEHFHALLANAMRSDHRETYSPVHLGSQPEDRLGKLWELHQSGALSEEEFLAQKRALLGNCPEQNDAALKGG